MVEIGCRALWSSHRKHARQASKKEGKKKNKLALRKELQKKIDSFNTKHLNKIAKLWKLSSEEKQYDRTLNNVKGGKVRKDSFFILKAKLVVV
jgi:hypothetical protein